MKLLSCPLLAAPLDACDSLSSGTTGAGYEGGGGREGGDVASVADLRRRLDKSPLSVRGMLLFDGSPSATKKVKYSTLLLLQNRIRNIITNMHSVPLTFYANESYALGERFLLSLE